MASRFDVSSIVDVRLLRTVRVSKGLNPAAKDKKPMVAPRKFAVKSQIRYLGPLLDVRTILTEQIRKAVEAVVFVRAADR